MLAIQKRDIINCLHPKNYLLFHKKIVLWKKYSSMAVVSARNPTHTEICMEIIDLLFCSG